MAASKDLDGWIFADMMLILCLLGTLVLAIDTRKENLESSQG